MNEMKDILSNRGQADNPFRMPEGYLDSFEDRLMARLAAEETEATQPKRPVWRILKPALTLAAMFALIFGTTAADTYATAEEEMIRPVSLINYYQTAESEEESADLDEETLLNYLATELSFADLAEIYAQTYQK